MGHTEASQRIFLFSYFFRGQAGRCAGAATGGARRGWFVGKVQGLADGHGDHSTAYNVRYTRRQTGERMIDGAIEAKLDPAEYGPEGEWVLLQPARR